MQTLELTPGPDSEQAMVVRPQQEGHAEAITPAQAKVDAVANLTMQAYARASTLQLTPEEAKALAAEFPDEAFQPGASGKEHLIYIEHAFLRDRLSSVFGPGQWALIPRNRWAEPFKTSTGKDASRVYVEAMLLIRGCFVAEAVGAMEYYPGNASQNYGDAVEGAKTAALRRCAKELGIGLQAWKKDFCAGWWKRRNGARTKNKYVPPAQEPEFTDTGEGTDLGPQKNFGASGEGKAARPASSDSPRTPDREQAARTVPNSNPVPTQRHKDRMLSRLIEVFGLQDKIKDFACDAGVLFETETLLDWPFRYVPSTAEQMDALEKSVAWFLDGNKGTMPFVNPEPLAAATQARAASPDAPHLEKGPAQAAASKPVEVPRDEHGDPDSPDAKWRAFPVPYGKHSGIQLGKLDKNVLWGFWQGHEVKPTFEGRDGKPVKKKPEQRKKDQAFRDVLDQAGLHYNFKPAEDK